MYLRAWFSESAFSPKCKYSSSVVGTQNGSLEIICRKREGKKKKECKTKQKFTNTFQVILISKVYNVKVEEVEFSGKPISYLS